MWNPDCIDHLSGKSLPLKGVVWKEHLDNLYSGGDYVYIYIGSGLHHVIKEKNNTLKWHLHNCKLTQSYQHYFVSVRKFIGLNHYR